MNMKRGLKIVGFLTLLLAFVACEKCDKPVSTEDPFVNASDRSSEKEGYGTFNRSQDDLEVIDDNTHGDGGITDPNEDEDFDGIVDPDGDEDYDKEGK
jgi:hypothetical protein